MTIIGVLFATAATQVLGVTWYSDVFFRKPWMRGLRGSPVVDDKKVYIAVAAAMFSLAFFFNATLQLYFNVYGLHSAVRFALMLSIPVEILQISHTGFEGRSIGTYLVNAGFDATVLVIVCSSVILL